MIAQTWLLSVIVWFSQSLFFHTSLSISILLIIFFHVCHFPPSSYRVAPPPAPCASGSTCVRCREASLTGRMVVRMLRILHRSDERTESQTISRRWRWLGLISVWHAAHTVITIAEILRTSSAQTSLIPCLSDSSWCCVFFCLPVNLLRNSSLIRKAVTMYNIHRAISSPSVHWSTYCFSHSSFHSTFCSFASGTRLY